MNKYIPFLKLKSGEIAAINGLEKSLKNRITPFFDFPYNSELSVKSFVDKTIKLVRKFEINLKEIQSLYLDNFDVNSSLTILGEDSYLYLLSSFRDFPIIPVVSIDRSKEHNLAVLKAKQSGYVTSGVVALRLVGDDFQDYELISDEVEEELGDVFKGFEQIDLILDCRVCLKMDHKKLAKNIDSFIVSFCSVYPVRSVVVTGSSIAASIADIIPINSELSLDRAELKIYREVSKIVGESVDLILGDYGTVSPYYSEVDIPPEVMQNVMTPKIIYANQDQHFFIRGASLRTHPRGSAQYNDLSRVLVSKSFYRREWYSFGDGFFYEKSQGLGAKVTPGSIVKPIIIAHISYMMKDWV